MLNLVQKDPDEAVSYIRAMVDAHCVQEEDYY